MAFPLNRNQWYHHLNSNKYIFLSEHNLGFFKNWRKITLKAGKQKKNVIFVFYIVLIRLDYTDGARKIKDMKHTLSKCVHFISNSYTIVICAQTYFYLWSNFRNVYLRQKVQFSRHSIQRGRPLVEVRLEVQHSNSKVYI